MNLMADAASRGKAPSNMGASKAPCVSLEVVLPRSAPRNTIVSVPTVAKAIACQYR